MEKLFQILITRLNLIPIKVAMSFLNAFVGKQRRGRERGEREREREREREIERERESSFVRYSALWDLRIRLTRRRKIFVTYLILSASGFYVRFTFGREPGASKITILGGNHTGKRGISRLDEPSRYFDPKNTQSAVRGWCANDKSFGK